MYRAFLILVVVGFALATPYVMNKRSAQAEADQVALYCKVAPEKAKLEGVDCVLLKRKQ